MTPSEVESALKEQRKRSRQVEDYNVTLHSLLSNIEVSTFNVTYFMLHATSLVAYFTSRRVAYFTSSLVAYFTSRLEAYFTSRLVAYFTSRLVADFTARFVAYFKINSS